MKGMDLHSRLKSVSHALNGLRTLVRTQPNARIHLVASLAAVALAAMLGLSSLEWCGIIIAVAIVWVAEALNTSIEALCNAVSTEFHPQIRIAKDVAASGVLLAALAAVMLGLIIFLRHLVRLI